MSAMKQIKASARTSGGKGAARAIRRKGLIPAVIYGGNEPAMPISLDYALTNRLIYAGHFLTTVFEIDVDGQKVRAIPRDFQLEPVKDTPLHVDFLRVAVGSTLKVTVPVHFANTETNKAIKEGGIINVVRHEVELMVPADDIPDAITIDVTGLTYGDTIRMSSAGLKAGYSPIVTDRDFVLATIVAPKVASEAEDGADAGTDAAGKADGKENAGEAKKA